MAKKRKKDVATTPCCSLSNGDEEHWKVDSAADTLRRAQEIRTDAMLMGKVRKKLREDQKNIDKVLMGKK